MTFCTAVGRNLSSTRSPLALLALAMTVAGCERVDSEGSASVAEVPDRPDATRLVGRRAIYTTPEGRHVPVFDDESPPTVIIEEPLTSARYALQLDGVQVAEAIGGTVPIRLRARLSAEGEGLRSTELRLVRQTDTSSEAVSTWPILVGIAPEQTETLRRVTRLRDQRRLREAIALLDASSPADPWLRMWAAYERARIATALDETSSAVGLYAAAAELAEALSFPSVAMAGYSSAFFHSHRLGDLPTAQRHLRDAILAAEGLQDTETTASINYNQGLLAHTLGNYFEAARFHEKAAKGFESIDRSLYASHVRRELAAVLSELGRHEAALKITTDVVSTTRAANADPKLLAQAMSDLAWYQIRAMSAGAIRKNPEGPRRLLEAALEIWQSLNRPRRQFVALNNLAALETLDNRPEAALQLIARSRAIAPEMRVSEARFVDLLEADIHLRTNNAPQARAVLDRFLTHTPTTTASDWTWRAYHGLARVELMDDHLDEAAAYFEKALHDRRAAAARAAVRSGEATFLADRAEVIRQATRLYLQLGDVERAFYVDATGRAEVIRSLETDVRRARLSPEDRPVFDKLVMAYLAVKSDAEATTGPRRSRRAADAHRVFDAVFSFLDARVPPEPDAPTASDVRALLSDREAVITFSRAPKGILSFWIDTNGIAYREAPEFRPAHIWPDRIERVAHVYVIPGDVAEARDLHAAELPDGRALIEAVGVSYLPHSGFLVPRAVTATGGPLIVAVSGRKNDGEGSAQLPYVRREARAVARTLPGATVMTDESATREQVLKAMDGRSFVHFAGHGVIRLNDPWDAHLSMAMGERLTLEDILIARPHVGAAVLNGCETGKGGLLSRREAVGLAEAFLISGAAWVLASAERVRDDRAMAFVEAFYRAGGADRPTRAFRAVAREQIRTNRTDWRAYRLFGRRPAP